MGGNIIDGQMCGLITATHSIQFNTIEILKPKSSRQIRLNSSHVNNVPQNIFTLKPKRLHMTCIQSFEVNALNACCVI